MATLLQTMANGLRKTVALLSAPVFYGLDKFFKSLGNLARNYKTARSLTRLTAIAGATTGGVFLGAAMLPQQLRW